MTMQNREMLEKI